jgi:adenosylhomocysteine nucleosidase
MTVAVISALQPELDLVVESLIRVRGGSIAGWASWQGEYRDTPVVAARAGLGKVNTAALAALLWERHRPELMVFTGVAGGLDPELAVGDMVIGERTIQYDAGMVSAAGLQRYQAGHLPFHNPTDDFGFTPSAQLLDLVRRAGDEVDLNPVLGHSPTVRSGTILTGDVFLQDAQTRDRLYAELSAQAIDMEGAALGQVASHLGVDHIVIRAISDLAASEAAEHFDRYLPEVSANSARLVVGLLDRLQEDDRDFSVGS